jgi:hypothetical protein
MPGSILSERLSAVCPIDLETFSRFGPACHPVLAGYASRHLNTPSVALSIITCPSGFTIRLGVSARCSPLSTCVYQAHAEGRGCLPFTREAGVDGIPLAQYH